MLGQNLEYLTETLSIGSCQRRVGNVGPGGVDFKWSPPTCVVSSVSGVPVPIFWAHFRTIHPVTGMSTEDVHFEPSARAICPSRPVSAGAYCIGTHRGGGGLGVLQEVWGSCSSPAPSNEPGCGRSGDEPIPPSQGWSEPTKMRAPPSNLTIVCEISSIPARLSHVDA